VSMHRVDHLRWALPFPRTGSALSAWVDCKEQAACSQRGQGLFALRFRLGRRQESRLWPSRSCAPSNAFAAVATTEIASDNLPIISPTSGFNRDTLLAFARIRR
jgi:hypothetical protein